MFASRQRARFGKREVFKPDEPVTDAAAEMPHLAEASDSYRVLPEPPAVPGGLAGPVGLAQWVAHADVLQRLGPHVGDTAEPLPEPGDHDRKVFASYISQEALRTGLEDELLRRHGHNAIRPFYVFGEGVFNTAVGRWLVEALGLMPYDAWNTTYLPLDAPTAAAMRLPYHPRASIARVDAVIHERLDEQRQRYEAALDQCVAALQAGWDDARVDRFVAWRDALRDEVLAYAEQLKPMVVGLIAEVQEKSTRI
ncbi:hypothetical protein [Novosphingobium sp. FKTRR1]|uniref:hypothetical protein n=1 Tax=Novosphingobium sp. FKTRR1 TaxID=2879118 RepID=UPI001CEFB93D|nr:hypothetical protein [Novosphingobium sp. FKTRR1]